MDDWGGDTREEGLAVTHKRHGRRGAIFPAALATPCVEWQGARDADGYGVRGNNIKVHREAWEAQNGAIPKGAYVLHHCDNPPCYSGEHLYLGNSRQNQIDRRERRPPNGVTHKLTREQVSLIQTRYSTGSRQVDLATEYGVHQTTISSIVVGKTWKEVM